MRAGAARISITPDGPVPLFGHPATRRISTGVHDPLWVSALHLRTGEVSMVLITLDLLFLEPQFLRQVRSDIAKDTAVKEEAIFINCTHTHSGPVTGEMIAWRSMPGAAEPDPAYMETVRQVTVQAAAHAMATTRPAEFAWTTASAQGLGGHCFLPDAPPEEIGILSVREPGGDAIAVAMVHAMPPTAAPADATDISSDTAHFSREHIIQAFHEETVVLSYVGACADQDPAIAIKEHSFAEAERLGTAAGAAVVDAIRALGDDRYNTEVDIVTRRETVELPRHPLPSNWDARVTQGDCRAKAQQLKGDNAPFIEQHRANLLLQGANATLGLIAAEQRDEISPRLAAYKPFEIDAIRFNDICFVGLPGEVSASYARAIREQAGRPTLISCFANGNLQGYVLDATEIEAGRCGPAGCLFGPAAGEALVNKAVALVQSL